MVAIRRILVLCILHCVAEQVVAPQPQLSRKQKKHYQASLRFLRSVHGVEASYHPTEYLPHLAPAHPNIDADAWHFATTPGNGPVLWTMDSREENFFATTKIPSQSRLGSTWNLDWRDNPKDAYALWHIHPGGHKLLRLDLWPAGGHTVEDTTIDLILARMACLAQVRSTYRSAMMRFWG